MSEGKVGEILDGLGVRLRFDDGDLPESAVIIVKTISRDGGTSVGIGVSEGCTWVEQLGLITAARNIVEQEPLTNRDDT